MKEIPLNKGFIALVDDEDFSDLIQYRWWAVKGRYTYYASRRLGCNTNTKIDMHRHIMKPGLQDKIDHKDGNGLNCQKENMRVCTNQQNCLNRKPDKECRSSFKGVRPSSLNENPRWRADISFNGHHYYLGSYDLEKDAALAYNQKAMELCGEFARLNQV